MAKRAKKVESKKVHSASIDDFENLKSEVTRGGFGYYDRYYHRQIRDYIAAQVSSVFLKDYSNDLGHCAELCREYANILITKLREDPECVE